MERREERAWLDVECVLGDLRDSSGDAEAMIWTQAQRAKDQQIERAF